MADQRRDSFALDLAEIDEDPAPKPTAMEISKVATLPVREVKPEKEGYDQINIKAPILQAKLLQKMMDL